ncbi:MAG TPA: DUF3078 domain-containing protein [Puia sp.]|nr:DUF3078 domain-containing protein [Puia sp.]
MKRIGLGLCVLMLFSGLRSQDKTVQDLKSDASQTIKKNPNDTIPMIWKIGGLFNLNFNQAALSNWSAGGDNSSLSLATFMDVFAFYKNGRNAWDNTLDLAYGYVHTTSLGSRKSDDRIDLLSKYGYEVAKSWYVGGLFNFRSQFAKGYAYQADGSKVLTSDAFAPAYLLLSAGMNYKPNDEFSVFLSPATARWVIVNNDSLASVAAFGVDSGKNSRFEFGAFATISYIKKISASAAYTGRLDLFSNYLHNPQNISINMTNVLAVKVTKIISMSFTVNVIYDNDIKSVKSDGTAGGPKPQIQELMAIGLAFKFGHI